jgi:hypothetical protein
LPETIAIQSLASASPAPLRQVGSLAFIYAFRLLMHCRTFELPLGSGEVGDIWSSSKPHLFFDKEHLSWHQKKVKTLYEQH